MTVLSVDGVTKRYGDFTAVDDVTFEVQPGEVCGFLGPNGAGKTTTLRMILEIIRPTEGSITVLDAPSALEVRHRIGYLPEEKGLYKKMTAAGAIAYFASLKGLSRKESHDRAFELLERYGLGSFAKSRTEALSKGMGQKVQVLAAIAHDPDLVILDEPFSGLDPVNQQVMEEIVRDFAARGKTVIFSTHVMEHAERLCDRLVLIASGKKIFDGSLGQAKARLPRQVRVQTSDDIAGMAEIDGIRAVTTLEDPKSAVSDASSGSGTNKTYEIEITEDTDPRGILRYTFEQGIELQSFDVVDPSLHDVFVHLVGPEARTASLR